MNGNDYYIINFSKFETEGYLVALESGKQVPFNIRRVYYVWGASKDSVRGNHAHKNLEQIVICMSGSCEFTVNDGIKKETFKLDTPDKGVYIRNQVWREYTNFSPDCVLMVLASQHYDKDDYVFEK